MAPGGGVTGGRRAADTQDEQMALLFGWTLSPLESLLQGVHGGHSAEGDFGGRAEALWDVQTLGNS